MAAPRPFYSEPRRLGPLLQRLYRSAVVWSWVFNGFRLASGVILLPLLLKRLSTPDLGMYYVFLNVVALVPLVDFGFAPTIGRFVSYAMGGAESIPSQGVAQPGKSSAPNYVLLWQLFFTTRWLYRYITLLVLVLLGTWGTYNVELRINETASPFVTRLAWGVTLAAALFDIYSNWWITYLRSMDQVRQAARIALLGIMLRLGIAAGLLLCGGGLLSIPAGSLLGSTLQRVMARRLCRQLLSAHPPPDKVDVRKHLRILWPNTWRLGVQFVSGYLTVGANTAICLHLFNLTAVQEYGLSAQLLTIASGMAAVWTSVKWPVVGQYLVRHDGVSLQRILWPRIWLQTLTFLLLAGGLLLGGPYLLAAFAHGKHVLPLKWLALMALSSFFELQFNFWGTLISMGNRLSYLWPTVATNVLSLVLSLGLVHFTSLGLGALVLGPLLAGSLFNYWYWPPFAARGLGIGLFRFLFLGPQPAKPAAGLTPV
jgi:hypothetical protein